MGPQTWIRKNKILFPVTSNCNLAFPFVGLLWCSDGKESVCNVGDPDSIPKSGRSLRRGNGYSLQYSCPENPMDRGAWKFPWGCRVRHDLVTNWLGSFPLESLCLAQWNYKPGHVGSSKTDGSWWRVLTKRGPLEKGIADHFSILGLRTLWTEWKGKKIGHWKMNTAGQ